MKLILKLTLLASLSTMAFGATAKSKIVQADQLKQELKNAQPGDSIIIARGAYKDIELKIEAAGTQQKPIVVTVEDPANSYFTGSSTLRLAGEWVVVSGLTFRNGTPAKGPVVEYRIGDRHATNCRITECAVDNYNPADRSTDYSYVHIYGRNNRFDHNDLTGKLNLGVTLIVMINEERSRQNFHSIDHNYFGPRPVYGSNGSETIRVGTSQQAYKSSNTLIENNFFDRCNGEVEVVSIKSCDNIIRNNVFYRCQGVLALRHGKRNLAEGNVFLGEGVRNTGGVRVVDANHIIRGNFFGNLKGDRFFGALGLMNAVPNSLPNRYTQVGDVQVSGNTFVDCDNILFGVGKDQERTLAPERVLFADNTFYYGTPVDHIYQAISPLEGYTFRGNATTPLTTTPPEGFTAKDIAKPAPPYSFYPTKKLTRKSPRFFAGRGNRDMTAYVNSQVKAEAHRQPVEIIRITPGQDALLHAVRAAETPLIIELSEAGDYPISDALVIDKDIVIRKACSLAADPVVRFNGTRKADMITIVDGGSLTVSGIEFSGELEPGKALAAAGISSASKMIRPYSLAVENCTFRDFGEGGFFAVRGLKNTMAESVIIRGCTFRGLSGDAINFAAEREDIGRYNVENLTIENCTFYRLLGLGINVYRGGSDESTAGPYVSVAHCTFEDVCNKERGSVMRLIGPQVMTIRDCNFSGSGRGGAAIRLDEATWEKIAIFNCNFWNSGRILTMTGKVVTGPMFDIKPVYRNAGALDFGLSDGSGLVGVASDGTNIGIN